MNHLKDKFGADRMLYMSCYAFCPLSVLPLTQPNMTLVASQHNNITQHTTHTSTYVPVLFQNG